MVIQLIEACEAGRDHDTDIGIYSHRREINRESSFSVLGRAPPGIRGNAGVIERKKQRSRRHGRSLQKDLRALLEDTASTLSIAEARQVAGEWRRRFGKLRFSDSAELIREDRER